VFLAVTQQIKQCSLLLLSKTLMDMDFLGKFFIVYDSSDMNKNVQLDTPSATD